MTSPRFALPWSRRETPTQDRVLVFASSFDAHVPRQHVATLRHTFRVRQAARGAAGCVAVTLAAFPRRRAYCTLSVWQDEESLRRFAHGDVHRAAVRGLHAAGTLDGTLISWDADAGTLPSWDEALQRIASAGRGSYRRLPA